MTSGRVLVTGGAGFTGVHLVRSLLDDGRDVRVLTRSASSVPDRLPDSVELMEGDIADPGAAEEAVRGSRVIYHLASTFREAGIPDERHRAVHVDGTGHLLEAARRQGIERFVHCSTVGVHGHIEDPPADETHPHDPGDIYQETKSEGERLALSYHENHGLPLTVVRPTAIYGPGDRRLLKLFRLIDRRRFVMIGDGTPRYHLVHVSDLVRGLRLAARRPEALGEVFILGGEEAPTLNELAALIADAVGAPEPRFHVPARPVQIAGTLCERVCRIVGVEPPLYRRRVDFFTKSRWFSIDRARRELGYEPRVPLGQGLRATAGWYRDHGYLSSGIDAG